MSASRYESRGPLVGNTSGRQFSLDWGDQSHVRELRVWYRLLESTSVAAAPVGATDWRGPVVIPQGHTIEGVPTDFGDRFPAIRCIQIMWRTPDGRTIASPPLGPVPIGHDTRPTPHDAAVIVAEGAAINGIFGYRGEDWIHGIGLIDQDGRLQMMGSEVGTAFSWELRDEKDFRPLATGVFGYTDRTGLSGVGLRYTRDGLEPARIPCGPGGRVVPRVDAGKPPQHDHERIPNAPSETLANAERIAHTGLPTPESKRPNPNYRRVDVRRIDQWDDVVFLHAVDGSTTDYRYNGRARNPETHQLTDTYVTLDGTILTVDFGPNQRVTVPDGTSFSAPSVPLPAASDGPTWDNIFGLDSRVDYLAWSTRGLDISRLAPFNFQEATGVLQQEVFKAPAPGSRDFHIADNGKAVVVPNGWQFVGDVAGTTKGRTASSFSEEETRLTWATSLGISAEGDALGAKLAYKNNSKAHAELSASSSGKIVTTTTEKVQISHSLVVDLATVALADGFRAAVEQLAKQPTQAGIEELIARFGSHFAFAVTFGSKSWEQRHETEESVADSMTHGSSQDQSIEAGYHGAVGGASVSVSVGGESSSNASTKRGTGSEVSSSGSAGTDAEPVPILLEVEQLTHLLTPVFFDDPYVYEDLKSEIIEYFATGSFDLGETYDENRQELRFDIAPARIVDRWEGQRTTRFDGTTTPAATTYWIHNGMRWETPADVGIFLANMPLINFSASSFPPSSRPPTSEGKAMFATGSDERLWWIRGGKRHLVRSQRPAEQDFEELNRFFYLPNGSFPATPEMLTAIPESGESVTMVGKLLRDSRTSEVWWVGEDQLLHPVPSTVVVEVLGGWELVAVVSSSEMARLPRSTIPASVEGKMIKTAGGTDSDVVWVIHRHRRHRIRTPLGIRKRGGFQQVAVVASEVRDWFPDSGEDAL